MRLFRFRKDGKEKPGALINGDHVDVSSFGHDYTESFFENNRLQELHAFLQGGSQLQKIDDDIDFAPPIARPSKIVCIGLNYIDHALETGATPPTEPVIFLKASSSLIGPNDSIVLPRGSKKTDWEVELAVVIGKKACYVEEENAMDYVAGYCLHNDVSEREYQLERGGTWDKGKGCDTFAPLGPYLVTPDEIENVDNLSLWLKVNGHTMQQGSTSNLIFKIPHLISYVSRFMTLLPGDVISTGTPAGVGLGMSPQLFLKEGDVVELGIDGLGTSRQTVKAYGYH